MDGKRSREAPVESGAIPFLVAAVLIPAVFGAIDYLLPGQLASLMVISPFAASAATYLALRKRNVPAGQLTMLAVLTFFLTMVLMTTIAMTEPTFKVYDQVK